mgnify:FL=1
MARLVTATVTLENSGALAIPATVTVALIEAAMLPLKSVSDLNADIATVAQRQVSVPPGRSEVEMQIVSPGTGKMFWDVQLENAVDVTMHDEAAGYIDIAGTDGSPGVVAGGAGAVSQGIGSWGPAAAVGLGVLGILYLVRRK